jgi:membrane protease YdiL (CAAX protease family)
VGAAESCPNRGIGSAQVKQSRVPADAVVLGIILAAAGGVVGWLWHRDLIRPGSWRRWAAMDGGGTRDLSAGPASLWLLCGVGLYFAQLLAAAIGLSVAASLRWTTGMDASESVQPTLSLRAQGLVQVFTYGLAVPAAIALAVLMGARARGRPTGLSFRWRDVPLGMGCALLAAPVYLAGHVAVTWTLTRFGVETERLGHDVLRVIASRRDDPWTWVLIAAAALGAPVVEEFQFRVFLGGAVLRRWGSPWLAIGGTSLLFGLVHAAVAPWYALPSLVLLGVLLAVAYERTHRPAVPVVMHAAFNASMITWVLLAS